MRRNPRRTDPLLVFVAVKKMAPSSREAIGPEVPDERLCTASVATWGNDVSEVPDACVLIRCLLVSAGVPRMRLCSSFVCCGTFVLSVGLFFFSTRSWFFSSHVSFDAMVRNFSF